MRRLFFLILSLLLAETASATITFVASAANDFTTPAASSVATTSGLNVTAGTHFVVVGCRNDNTTAINSVTDTGGNTWTALSINTVSSRTEMFWSNITTSNSSDLFTCNFAGNNSFGAIQVMQFSHTGTISLDVNQSTGSTTSATSGTSASFSTVAATEVVVGFGSPGATGETFTAGSGYTLGTSAPNGFSAMERQIFSSTQTGITQSLSWSSSINWALNTMSIQEVATGGGLVKKKKIQTL